MSDPTAIVMIGATGRMGRMILELAARRPDRYAIAGAVEAPGHPALGQPLSQLVPGGPSTVSVADQPPAQAPPRTVAIHFSLPGGSMQHLGWSRDHGGPVLIGTTGFSDAQSTEIRAASEHAPILLTPNTSRGVNVLFWLARQATRLLGPDYDIEIVEMHHHHKEDAPSGTARRLTEVVLAERQGNYDRDARHGRQGQTGRRPAGEVGVHALRGGDVVGDHTVVLAGPNERVELTHRAHSRELFAAGALQAADWLREQAPGFYTMDDLLGLKG